jgi:hypothetical protein
MMRIASSDRKKGAQGYRPCFTLTPSPKSSLGTATDAVGPGIGAELRQKSTFSQKGQLSDEIIWKSGARGRGRTADTAIFSRMLYQLSYPGTGALEACL